MSTFISHCEAVLYERDRQLRYVRHFMRARESKVTLERTNATANSALETGGLHFCTDLDDQAG